MQETAEQTPVQAAPESTLAEAVQQALAASSEPQTLPKIRARLGAAFKSSSIEEVGDYLLRQLAAETIYLYPKYRSQHDRYWDRPMPVHVAALAREVLAEGPLSLAELRRKLPAYAATHVESVLQEQTSRGLLFRHPAVSSRGGDRFGIRPADPKDYLRDELATVFNNMEQLGFNRPQVRAGALELLHEEEWDLPAAATSQPEPPTTPEV
jgi:hypothetical protein